MNKSKAIELLGGSVTAAARAIGVSYQAVDKWPEDSTGDLPPRIEDRVLAALARKHLPPDVIGADATPPVPSSTTAGEAA